MVFHKITSLHPSQLLQMPSICSYFSLFREILQQFRFKINVIQLEKTERCNSSKYTSYSIHRMDILINVSGVIRYRLKEKINLAFLQILGYLLWCALPPEEVAVASFHKENFSALSTHNGISINVMDKIAFNLNI